MVKQTRGKPDDETQAPGDSSHLESAFQAHQAATSAKLEEMQTALRADMATSLAAFRSMLVDEIKQHLQPKNPKPQLRCKPGSKLIPQPDGTVLISPLSSPVVQQRVVTVNRTLALHP